MNAKEKALELVNKFHQHSKWQTDEVRWIHAKSCAIIAVDEILLNNSFPCVVESDLICNSDYWQEVKNEIEKL